jgi:hypothetical protein
MVIYFSVLMVEGFTLCIIVSCFLIVMSVTLSSRVQTAIWFLSISRTRFIVVGLILIVLEPKYLENWS